MQVKMECYGMIGRSPAMERVYDAIDRVRNSDATVYIAGASGTGKELVARALHYHGRRKKGPFRAANVTEFPSGDVLTSALFGHVRGAFTGALADHDGLFVQAHRGTLLLDEIAEMSADVQVKLLRVLQEREVIPVGGKRAVPFDARLVAASSKPLEVYVEHGAFRPDLYYRLRVVEIRLPPLRERQSDIRLLADHFVKKYGDLEQKEDIRLAEETYTWLETRYWPGNVRELENTIAGAIAWTRKQELYPRDFLLYHQDVLKDPKDPPEEETAVPINPTLQDVLRYAEKAQSDVIRSFLNEQLIEFDGNVSEMARHLRTDRTNLKRLFRRHGISPPLIRDARRTS